MKWRIVKYESPGGLQGRAFIEWPADKYCFKGCVFPDVEAAKREAKRYRLPLSRKVVLR